MQDAGAKPDMLVIGAVPQELRDALSSSFSLVSYVMEGSEAKSADGIPAGPTAVLTRAVCGLPAAVMDKLPGLRLVLSLGAGLDKIDLDAAAQRGITVVNTPDEMTEDVADYAVAMFYAVQRQLAQADALVRSGAWGAQPFPLTHRVAGRAVGVVGMGRIGRRVAEKAAALGMAVHYHSRARKADVPHRYHGTVLALAEAVDVLVLACAGTEETRNIVDAPVLDALGPAGIVINVSRGSVVDEEALIAALGQRSIRGAALDVFASEPKLDPRFRALDNVLLSPHAAALTVEARAAAIATLANAGRAYVEGAAGAPKAAPSRLVSRKVYPDPPAALEGLLFDGMTIMSGGFGLSGNPEMLIPAIRDSGVKDLTIISNNCGADGFGLWTLLNNGQIRKMISSYVGENKLFEQLYLSGDLELELNPQGTLAERIRAGGAGIPAFYTRTGVGTIVAEGKPVEDFGGLEYVRETWLKADLAIVKAWRGDPAGNLLYRKTARNFNPVMATAAAVTVAEVEEIVEAGMLGADCIHTPGIYVDRLIQGAGYAKRIEHLTVRQREVV